MQGRACVTACSSASAVLALSERKTCFSLAQACSMGFRSGEYGGRYSSSAPAAAISSRTPLTLWALRLSMTTTSPVQRRAQHLLHIGQENVPIGGFLDGHGRQQTAQTQGAEDGQD